MTYPADCSTNLGTDWSRLLPCKNGKKRRNEKRKREIPASWCQCCWPRRSACSTRPGCGSGSPCPPATAPPPLLSPPSLSRAHSTASFSREQRALHTVDLSVCPSLSPLGSRCDRYLPSRGNRIFPVGPHYEDALPSMRNYGQVPGRDMTSLQSNLERTVQDSNEPSGDRWECESRDHRRSKLHFSFLFAQGKIIKNELP
jgi:hypothetical protein